MSQDIRIPFNKPHLVGNELEYIADAVASGQLAGNGKYTKKCQSFFENRYGFKKCLLTTSCTDALEMAAILAEIKPGDEVIMPSFTFVSTANAFVLRGAKIVFCDSRSDHPGMDEGLIESLVTKSTRAIVPVHYAGVACDMDKIMEIAERHKLLVIEDAAQAIESFYTGADGIKRPLGNIGHMAAFSFHETKNIISGEGGMLVVNDQRFVDRAEIIWEKGTNRAAFFRGDIDKYGWVDIGSSFLPSEVIAAFLWAQLEKLDDIQRRRLEIWQKYSDLLAAAAVCDVATPMIPSYACNNAHMYYLVFRSLIERSRFISTLRSAGIMAVFHYQSLHRSPFFGEGNAALKQSDMYSDCLLRLPFYYSVDLPFVMDTMSEIAPFAKAR